MVAAASPVMSPVVFVAGMAGQAGGGEAESRSGAASGAGGPGRVAALQRASRCERGRKRSDRRAAVSS